jgi:hypothetical protein
VQSWLVNSRGDILGCAVAGHSSTAQPARRRALHASIWPALACKRGEMAGTTNRVKRKVVVSDIVRWTCPTCKKTVLTAYCAQCGEEPHGAHECTLRGLAERLVHAFTSIDARVVRTAWCLLRHPGRLTQAWTAGTRKPYVAPFQLFLIANVLFFALQWLTGMNIFSSTLESHLHHQDWSVLAESLVARRLDKTGIPLELYRPVFDHAVVINAKSLIVLMTVPFALLLPLMCYRAHRPLMVHVVFSLHHYTFLLLLFCAALLAAKLSALLGGGGLDSPGVDNVLTAINLAVCAAYLYTAIGPVYGASGVVRAGQALVLTLAVGLIALGYRFVLFLITLYGT